MIVSVTIWNYVKLTLKWSDVANPPPPPTLPSNIFLWKIPRWTEKNLCLYSRLYAPAYHDSSSKGSDPSYTKWIRIRPVQNGSGSVMYKMDLDPSCTKLIRDHISISSNFDDSFPKTKFKQISSFVFAIFYAEHWLTN